MKLEEFLEDKLKGFEEMASKRNLSPEQLNIAKNTVANRLTYIALLFFRDKEEEIKQYLNQRGYNPDAGRKKEEADRQMHKSELEQNSDYN